MLSEHQPLIVNVIGHMLGAILFGIFLVLALRGGAGQHPQNKLLSVASVFLAFFWNAGSFSSIVLPPGPIHWVTEAASFCSLSLLPAVLLHLSLDGRFRRIAVAGYVVSGTATAMHLGEGLDPLLPLHRWALWMVTLGFAALTTIYALRVLREGKGNRDRTSRMITSMSLLLFAVTLSHFGSGHPPEAWKELLVHHAGIPLALVILLQDYRFVFLDTFVRFVANVILAGLLSYAGINVAANLAPETGSPHPLADVLAVAGLCGLLILFAYLRGIVQQMLTKAVFRRSSIEGIVHEFRSKASDMRDEGQYLKWASERVAALENTPRFELLNSAAAAETSSLLGDPQRPFVADHEPDLGRDPRWSWAEVIVPIPLSIADVKYLLLGRRPGGRRYLSEDLRILSYVSRIIVDEVGRFRSIEMQRLASEAELRALHSQIKPHFLFNALNTVYGIIPREAAGARRTILNLANIFRYVLQSDRKLIPLSEEMKIVNAYLEIERLRLGSRLQTVVQIDKGAEPILIPTLTVQPLVENAIKHGLSNQADEGWLRLSANVIDGNVKISVEDSGGGTTATSTETPAGAGIGLANVSRRLQLCFGPDAVLDFRQGEFGTRVQFSVPVRPVSAS